MSKKVISLFIAAAIACSALGMFTVSVAASSAVIDIAFDANGAVNNASESAISSGSAGSVRYDSSIKRYVGVFDGETNAINVNGLSNDILNSIEGAASLEVYFKASYFPDMTIDNNADSLLAAAQAGGLGLEIGNNSDGNYIEFFVRSGDGYASVQLYGLEVGEFYHVVGVYDGENVSLSINELMYESTAMNGAFSWPTGDNAAAKGNFYVGADTFADGSAENHSSAEIAIARVYTRALTEAEVAALYNSRNGSEQNPPTSDGSNIVSSICVVMMAAVIAAVVMKKRELNK